MRTVFNHIPKTAGTSIRQALAEAMGEPMAVFDPTESHPSHRTLIAHAGAHQLIASHMFFYPGERLAAGWYYATLLRDPLDRFLSQYFYLRQVRGRALEGESAQHLSDYLADPDPNVRRSHSNWQARYFAARLCKAPEDLDEEELLKTAIESLDDYDLVGVYDDLPGFVDVYCRDMELPATVVPRLNVTQGRAADRDIPAALKETVLARNRVDSALYEWAQHRFARDRQRREPLDTARQGREPSPSDAANFGNLQIEILSVGTRGRGPQGLSVEPGGRVRLLARCRSRVTEPDLTAGFALHDSAGRVVLGSNSYVLATPLGGCHPGTFDLEIGFTAPDIEGEYEITLALHKGESHLDGCYHWWEGAARLRIAREASFVGRLRARWRSFDTTGVRAEPSFNLTTLI